ncbi:hypothetical protein F2P79_019971 [Pimephales promelas]|nr:hypothetical protein F2P79_019971 [Pimephales promelas]
MQPPSRSYVADDSLALALKASVGFFIAVHLQAASVEESVCVRMWPEHTSRRHARYCGTERTARSGYGNEQVCTVGCYGNRHTRREMNTGTQPEQNTELWTRTGLLKVSSEDSECVCEALRERVQRQTSVVRRKETEVVVLLRSELQALRRYGECLEIPSPLKRGNGKEKDHLNRHQRFDGGLDQRFENHCQVPCGNSEFLVEGALELIMVSTTSADKPASGYCVPSGAKPTASTALVEGGILSPLPATAGPSLRRYPWRALQE